MKNKQPSTVSRQQLALLAVLGLILIGGMIWANYNYLNTPKYAHRDFMSLWGGGWAILDGLDPYDPEIWRPLRLQLGSKWLTGDQGNPFPLWTLMLMTPLSTLSLGWGAAIWLTLSQVLFAVSLFLIVTELAERRPTVVEFTMIALGAFTFRGTMVTMHNGQITLILFFVLTLFLVLLKRQRPFAAGFALAFIVLKPNPFLLFAPLLALWMLANKRWRIIAGGTTAFTLLLAISWLIRPGWLFTWQTVREKTATSIRSFIMPTFWGLATEISIDFAPLIGLLLVTALTILLGWLIFVRQGWSAQQVVSMAIIGSLLITPYAWAYEHVLLLLPLILTFLSIKQRPLAWLMWIAIVFVLPWIFYRASEAYGRGTIEVLVPLLTGLFFALLLYSRQQSQTSAQVEAEPAA